MNSLYIGRNTKASENGIFCEEYARRVIPGLEWIGEIYDAVLKNVPVDVKGCETWYKMNNPYTDKRAGRVTLDKLQDEELKAKNGKYFCVVHTGELVVKSFFVPAVLIKFGNSDKKQMSWTSMQRLAEGAC